VGAAIGDDLRSLETDSAAYEWVQNSSLEPHEDFSLSFIEFDAGGKPARDGQIESAMASIRKIQDKGAVVLFVHGWGHSADTRDPHVKGFRDVLSRLKGTLPNRTLVGIYVGWPARWVKGRLHFLTFWDRSKAAQSISRSDAVRDALRELQGVVEERRRAGDDIVSVAVGHSLGGKFLFTPMEERLEGDRRIRRSSPRASCLYSGISFSSSTRHRTFTISKPSRIYPVACQKTLLRSS
jgi:hypothetical protein